MFTSVVGKNQKFNEKGEISYFPGNTIVGNLYHNRVVVDTIQRIQEGYRNLSFAHKFGLMPEGSIHMTVFELLCDFNRQPDYWSKELSLDDPIEKTDEFFARKLQSIKMPHDFQMKPVGIQSTSLEVTPINEGTGKMLRDFRNAVSDATGIRFENHDTYKFHISFGYKLQELTADEEKIVDQLNQTLYSEVISKVDYVEIGAVDYTIFEDMSEFVPYSSEARRELKLRKYPTTWKEANN